MQSKLLILLFFIALNAEAQFRKGTRMLGASLGTGTLSTGKTEYSFPNGTQGYTSNQNQFAVSLTPSAGWFVSDNTAVGASLLFSSSHQKTWIESESNGNTYKKDNYHNTDFGLGAFLRYYFNSRSKLHPFAHAFANAGSGSTKTDGFYYLTNFSQTYKGSSSGRFFYNLGLNAGLTRRIHPAVGLEVFAGYVHSYNKFTTTTTSTTNDNGLVTTSEFRPTQKFSGNGLNLGIAMQVFLERQ